MKAPVPVEPSDRVWTIPNAISMLRIALIGVFLFFLVGKHDGWAILTLAVTGFSDFLDGYLARKWNQITRLGRLLDPLADRLLTIAIAVGLGARGVVPWWLVIGLLARDVVSGVVLAWGKSRGASTPAVTHIGKGATAGLYLFLPLAFIAYGHVDGVHAFALFGAVISGAFYWYSGLGYAAEVIGSVRSPRDEGARTAYDGGSNSGEGKP